MKAHRHIILVEGGRTIQGERSKRGSTVIIVDWRNQILMEKNARGSKMQSFLSYWALSIDYSCQCMLIKVLLSYRQRITARDPKKGLF